MNTGGVRWHFAEPFGIPVNFTIPLTGGEGEWIAAPATSNPMFIASIAALLLGVFSFFLPHTPPKAKGQAVKVRDILGLDALGLLKDRSFAVFAISSFLICIPLSAYYAFANPFLDEMGMVNATAKMTLGQMSEFFFMLVMPFFFARLGVKKMLLVGMLAWIGRYLLFTFGNNDSLVFMYYGGILLHGICYDFFFVTGQIYVDNEAPKEIRANAQGFIAMITYGVGMYIGSILAGMVVEHYQIMDGETIAGHNWPPVWIIMTIMAAVVAVAFALFFHEKRKPEAAPGKRSLPKRRSFCPRCRYESGPVFSGKPGRSFSSIPGSEFPSAASDAFILRRMATIRPTAAARSTPARMNIHMVLLSVSDNRDIRSKNQIHRATAKKLPTMTEVKTQRVRMPSR